MACMQCFAAPPGALHACHASRYDPAGPEFTPQKWPEVLAEIKADPELLRIPVIILTSSQAEEDILKTYDLHANGYIVKPVDLEQFFRIIKQIKEFWMSIVVLPPNRFK